MEEAVELFPGMRRITAPNPSPMTFRGTNTYLVGTRQVAVIDPGPDIPEHLAAIRDAVRGARIAAILVTHAHRDHSPLARALAAVSGAPILGFGLPEKGRSAVMAALAARGIAGGGEGVDARFRPDRELGDRDRVRGFDRPERVGSEAGARETFPDTQADQWVGSAEWSLEALWTPGHFPGHLCFALGDVVFSGDHVMGWASSLVSPPDGEVAAYIASCERLLARSDRRFLPGHGDPIEDPAGRLCWLIAHRREREAQIRAVLADGPVTVTDLARRLYADTAPTLLPAAERNVFAHLIDLVTRGLACAEPELSPAATFAAA